MIPPFLKLTQTQEDWQAAFAFQVFHRPAEEWLKMRWGFNAGALLEEALDRYKLFIESQSINELEFQTGALQNNTLALRGIYSPESGLKMVLLGKSCASSREQAKQTAQQYAREVFSTFPHDFLLEPAKTEDAYRQLGGDQLLGRNLNVVQVQRGILSLPATNGPHYLMGVWQASPRSNEQIWRALSAMPQAVLFNILIRPSVLFAVEKHALLEMKKSISATKENEAITAYLPWAENYLKRRLEPWKRFFLAQIHLVGDGKMENLVRSVGSALTRDSNELALPGYQARYPDPGAQTQTWRENIRSLEFTEGSLHLDDIADLEEVFSIFRFPYRQEAGLPGANFKDLDKEPDSMQ
jgi:hypothetical protein